MLLQIWGLQLALLYYLYSELKSQEGAPPKLMMYCAIYIHILSCCSNIAQNLKVFAYLTTNKNRAEHVNKKRNFLFTVIGFVDAWLIPLLCMAVGGFFLCTAQTVTDLILNS